MPGNRPGPDGSALRDRAVAAFDRAAAELGRAPSAELARALLRGQRNRLLCTLRLALVGRVSSGKSTLANALLGCYRVATGVTELTYNVNWLRYGEAPGLAVHFRDGRPSQHRDLAELERLTVRARADPELAALLGAIDYIEVREPNPQLHDFDLIDTAGLDSHFVADSANTLRFLGRADADVRAATVAHASQADALVLVFARGLGRAEADLLADFRDAGLSTATPITAIGALTKVELYWPERDPMAEGQRVAGKIMTEAGAGRLLFELRPVASLVAAGAATLTDEQAADLAELARLPPRLLAERASLGPLFTRRDYDDVLVPAARRQTLYRQLSGYGIVLGCELVREGVDSPASLRQELTRCSGMPAFRNLLTGHFGNRADLIKLQRAMTALQEQQQAVRESLPPRERLQLDTAIAEVTRLGFAEHAFAELAALQSYYDGRLCLDQAEAAELLQVTGEHGLSPAARLGLPASAPPAAALARARERLAYWAAFAAELSQAGPSRRAGQIIQRSYELLIQELEREGHVRAAPGPATGVA